MIDTFASPEQWKSLKSEWKVFLKLTKMALLRTIPAVRYRCNTLVLTLIPFALRADLFSWVLWLLETLFRRRGKMPGSRRGRDWLSQQPLTTGSTAQREMTAVPCGSTVCFNASNLSGRPGDRRLAVMGDRAPCSPLLRRARLGLPRNFSDQLLEMSK